MSNVFLCRSVSGEPTHLVLFSVLYRSVHPFVREKMCSLNNLHSTHYLHYVDETLNVHVMCGNVMGPLCRLFGLLAQTEIECYYGSINRNAKNLN